MEDYFQFVHQVTTVLENCHARYVIGGSMASSLYGEIRATYDVDLTIQLMLEQLSPFTQAFLTKGWYIMPESVQKAILRGGDFQIIDGSSGFKADCYMTNVPPSLREERTFERARHLTYGGSKYSANFMSPEDTILYKLEWYILGNSQKHLRDIGAMLLVQSNLLDFAYIHRWAGEVNAQEVWEKLESEYQKRNDESSR